MLGGLSWAETIGIVGAATSGAGSIVASYFAVVRAKKETRATVEHECLERIAELKGEQ